MSSIVDVRLSDGTKILIFGTPTVEMYTEMYIVYLWMTGDVMYTVHCTVYVLPYSTIYRIHGRWRSWRVAGALTVYAFFQFKILMLLFAGREHEGV